MTPLYLKPIYEKCPWCLEVADSWCPYCKGVREICTRHEPTKWVSDVVLPKSPWDEEVKKLKNEWRLGVMIVAWFAVVFWPLWLVLAHRIWG